MSCDRNILVRPVRRRDDGCEFEEVVLETVLVLVVVDTGGRYNKAAIKVGTSGSEILVVALVLLLLLLLQFVVDVVVLVAVLVRNRINETVICNIMASPMISTASPTGNK